MATVAGLQKETAHVMVDRPGGLIDVGSQVTPEARIPCSKRGYERASQPKETLMSFLDKFKNKRDSTLGKAKETHGSATGNKSLQNEGKADQSKADLKSAGENVKDAFKK